MKIRPHTNHPFRAGAIAFAGLILLVSLQVLQVEGSAVSLQQGPILTIKKAREEVLLFDADNDKTFDPGDRVRYVISYANTGSVEARNVVVEDDYDESLVAVSQISGKGRDTGGLILWDFESLPPGESGEFSYAVTLKSTLKPGSYKISNLAAISADQLERMEITVSHEVNVEPTPTPLPTATPVPPTPTPAPTATLIPSPTGESPIPIVGASVPTDDPTFYWIMGALIGLLEVGGLIVIGVIAAVGDFAEHERSRVVRVAIVVTMVVGAVLIMGIFGGIERGAAAGILGTIAGYLLRGIREE